MRWLLAGITALAALGATPPGASASPYAAPAGGVQLLGQTPWVDTSGVFQLRVGFRAVPGERVQVSVYDHVYTRTAFMLAAAGQVEGYDFYAPTVAVSSLPADPAGGYDLDLPVDVKAPAGDAFPEVSITDEPQGVFPVRVGLVDAAGDPIGAPVDTFLTYSQGTAQAQGFNPLRVAVVIPYTTVPSVGPEGQLGAPPPAESARLAALAGALNADNAVPASLLADPLTLASLQVGAKTVPANGDALANLTGTPDGGLMQVLPTTYAGVPPGDLAQAGLAGQIGPQLSAAHTELRTVLGTAPADSTWVVDGPLDQAGLDALTARGATQLVVPDSDLTPLSAEITTTFAHATQLGSAGSAPVTVFGADPGLSADFTRRDPPVLAANILLADLAMIFSETPGDTYARGVVAMPPAGWSVDPTFVSTLLSGLAGDPMVSATTVSGLFQTAGSTLGTRDLSEPFPPESPAVSALAAAKGSITAAAADIAALSAVLPSSSSELSVARSDLLLAESEAIDGHQRAAVLDAVGRVAAAVEHAVSLPPSTSITLTSTQGQIPITILAAGGLRPRVELKLKSQRLIFLAFRPPEGTCRVPTPTEETCLLALTAQNTTLKVPVETRSSGVFPVDVGLYAPNSSQVLASDQDTVRSTAVSTAAIVLIVVALVGLAFWWVRDVRKGRRPEGMLPPPDGPDSSPAPDALEEFFLRPPPSYGPDPMSPSPAPTGPTPLTDRYGSGREARE